MMNKHVMLALVFGLVTSAASAADYRLGRYVSPDKRLDAIENKLAEKEKSGLSDVVKDNLEDPIVGGAVLGAASRAVSHPLRNNLGFSRHQAGATGSIIAALVAIATHPAGKSYGDLALKLGTGVLTGLLTTYIFPIR
jgi:hypothetical protein